MTRVLIADDQALLRGSFALLINSVPELTVVGEAGNGVEAVALARRERPDVVLMDVRMPEMDGIEATRAICGSPDTEGVRVLMLTTFDLDDYVYAALRAGASGFLLKDTPPADLLAAVAVVAAGESLLSPSVTRRLIEEFVRRPEWSPDSVCLAPKCNLGGSHGVPCRKQCRAGGREEGERHRHVGQPPSGTPDLAGVTDREREVLTLIARGLSNADIAKHLSLSPATIKTHIGRLLAKLAARDRAQLVIAAYQAGLVTVQRPER